MGEQSIQYLTSEKKSSMRDVLTRREICDFKHAISEISKEQSKIEIGLANR